MTSVEYNTVEMRSKTLLKNTVYNQLMLPPLLEFFLRIMCELFKGIHLTLLPSNATYSSKQNALFGNSTNQAKLLNVI